MNNEAIYRWLAVVIMFSAFFAQTFSGALIVANYYSDTQSFAVHCENKSKPELHCNGKCQMRNQIKNEEKKDQQNPERKDNKSEVLFSSEHTSFVTNTFVQLSSQTYPPFVSEKENEMSRSLLRPPIV